MTEITINSYNFQNNNIYKSIEVDLPLWKRVSRFIVALIATLPLFIGLCFEPIRNYWMQVWTGKETILEKFTPPPAIIPPKVEEPKKDATVEKTLPPAIETVQPEKKPTKHVRFNFPSEEEAEKNLITAHPLIFQTNPPIFVDSNKWIKNGLTTATHSMVLSVIPIICGHYVNPNSSYWQLTHAASSFAFIGAYGFAFIGNINSSLSAITGMAGGYLLTSAITSTGILPNLNSALLTLVISSAISGFASAAFDFKL